jgi:L-amino acid N-acyltransferase YncA
MIYITREATINDISQITIIYNEGIEDRIATLEISLRTDQTMKEWLISRGERYKVLVIEDDKSTVIGWASINSFNSRCCYSGVGDFSIYIKRELRGKGIGKILLKDLLLKAKELKFHKLVLSTFEHNETGKGLYKSQCFREVGTYKEQGILDGKFVNVTIMEKIL